MIQFLRHNIYASVVLTVIRLYLGWEWKNAGWEKLSAGKFSAAGFLQGAVKNSTGAHPAVQGWWAHFLSGFAIPNIGLFNFLVPWGEFLVGIALITGLLTTFAALMGIIMNFAYMMSGTTSTNPQMALLTIFILIAAANAGNIGLDHYALKYVRKAVHYIAHILHLEGRGKHGRPAHI